MLKKLLSVCLSLWVFAAHADNKPVGFLWYNTPKLPTKETPKKIPAGRVFSQLNYQQKDAVLAYYTRESWHQSMQEQSIPAMRRYLALQHYWMERATDTTRLFEKTLLFYPEFRYDIKHPNSHIGLKIRDEEALAKEELILRTISKTHGLLYFYRGKNALDRQQNGIIANFANYYGLSLIPVSVDGELDERLPNSKKDHGQVKALGIRFFPALLLVNPKNQDIQPVAYGLVTQDILSRQFRLVATNFARGDL